MKKALVYGAGSIGKSVCGECFVKAGAEVTFADVDSASIEDIKRRGEYRVYASVNDYEKISGVKAVISAETPSLIGETDFACTAVGERGLEPVLRTIAKGLDTARGKPLVILLCENISHVFDRASEIMKNAAPVGSYILTECSVERMTKPLFSENGERDVLAEPFIPLILNRARYGCCEFFSSQNELFFEAENFESYYYRKIHTNNMGHAVLGYLGREKGYTYLSEAISDAEIRKNLADCLASAGRMLTELYGFSEADMSCHIKSIFQRFENKNLSDEISRVIRSPKRKLSRDERIIGTLLKCRESGVDTEPFYAVASAALGYRYDSDPESLEIGSLIVESGVFEALRVICGLDSAPQIAERIAEIYLKQYSQSALNGNKEKGNE